MKSILISWGTAIAALVGGLALFLWPSAPEALAPAEASTASRAKVTAVSVRAGSHTPVVTAFGEIRSQHEVTLAAEVAGRIAEVQPQLESGSLVDRDGLLVRIDDRSYREAVARAESERAKAQLVLAEEQREATQARRDWDRAGIPGEDPGPLVLREPQLAAARAALAAAEAMRVAAEADLDRTRVRAPFDGIVLRREVGPGSYVLPGTALASLASRERVEVRLPLAAADWALLPAVDRLLSEDWAVDLVSTETGERWQAFVARVERHVESKNRQRSLIAAVMNPLDLDPPLLPGTFVEAHIRGDARQDLFALPASALTRSGRIWHVDENDRLRSFASKPLFETDGLIYITVRDATDLAVLDRPLNSYVEGALVEVIVPEP